MVLEARDRSILDFERSWWQERGPKQQAIRMRLDISPALYYRRLRELVDVRAAYDYDPLLVRRLRRQRDSRRRTRFEGPARGQTR